MLSNLLKYLRLGESSEAATTGIRAILQSIGLQLIQATKRLLSIVSSMLASILVGIWRKLFSKLNKVRISVTEYLIVRVGIIVGKLARQSRKK